MPILPLPQLSHCVDSVGDLSGCSVLCRAAHAGAVTIVKDLLEAKVCAFAWGVGEGPGGGTNSAFSG